MQKDKEDFLLFSRVLFLAVFRIGRRGFGKVFINVFQEVDQVNAALVRLGNENGGKFCSNCGTPRP